MKTKSQKQRDRLRVLKRELISIIKAEGCILCGRHKGEDKKLTFHHADPYSKRFDIGSAIGKGTYNSFLQELSKCLCVCQHCHDVLHRNKLLKKKDMVQYNPWLSDTCGKIGQVKMSPEIEERERKKRHAWKVFRETFGIY